MSPGSGKARLIRDRVMGQIRYLKECTERPGCVHGSIIAYAIAGGVANWMIKACCAYYLHTPHGTPCTPWHVLPRDEGVWWLPPTAA